MFLKKTAIIFVVGTALSLTASANQEKHWALLEKAVQCKATPQEIAQINQLVDKKQLAFPEDKSLSPWGGVAMKVAPPISLGGVQSTQVMMISRFGFHLFIKSPHARQDSEAVIKSLQLSKELDQDGHFKYSRQDGDKTFEAMSYEEPNVNYIVGCTYDQDKVTKARKGK